MCRQRVAGSPEDVEPLLIEGDDTLCDAYKKYLQVLVLAYQWVKYRYNTDGTFTDAFEAEICSAPCFNPPDPDAEEE